MLILSLPSKETISPLRTISYINFNPYKNQNNFLFNTY